MKANELMIGDLVMSFGQVTEVWMVDASHEDEKDQLINYLDAREFSPILLTPKILENNGWCLDEIAGSYRHYDTSFWIGGRNAPFGIMVSNLYQDINYVHELQNVLKLCGIEKEIAL